MRSMRGAVLISALLVAAACGPAAAQSAPAGGGAASAFATAPSLDRINRACGDDPSCRGRPDNRNFYDLRLVNQRVAPADCNREEFVRRHGHEPCPNDMAWVCSANWQVNICIDRDLRREPNGRFMGSVGRLECQAWCQARGRRLPTNNEWMVACEGTQPAQCLRPTISHPILHRLRNPRRWVYNDVDCKVGSNAWRSCMSDLRLNDRLRDPQSGATIGLPTAAETRRCVSQYGVRNMVGVLGQWVVDTYASPAGGGGTRGQFNGGLYPQPASSCNYTTVAHPADYTDYSIGCRCTRGVDTGVTEHPQPVRRPARPTPAPRPARTAAEPR
jgi:hypothetical protein